MLYGTPGPRQNTSTDVSSSDPATAFAESESRLKEHKRTLSYGKLYKWKCVSGRVHGPSPPQAFKMANGNRQQATSDDRDGYGGVGNNDDEGLAFFYHQKSIVCGALDPGLFPPPALPLGTEHILQTGVPILPPIRDLHPSQVGKEVGRQVLLEPTWDTDKIASDDNGQSPS